MQVCRARNQSSTKNKLVDNSKIGAGSTATPHECIYRGTFAVDLFGRTCTCGRREVGCQSGFCPPGGAEVEGPDSKQRQFPLVQHGLRWILNNSLMRWLFSVAWLGRVKRFLHETDRASELARWAGLKWAEWINTNTHPRAKLWKCSCTGYKTNHVYMHSALLHATKETSAS